MDIALLREFLGEDGLVEDNEDFLLYFDGHLYWQFLFAPGGHLLLATDVEKTISAFPVVEIVIHHRCEITRGRLIGNEPPYERLTFWHPGSKEDPDTQAPCMLTKTPEGRLSLAPPVWWEEE